MVSTMFVSTHTLVLAYFYSVSFEPMFFKFQRNLYLTLSSYKIFSTALSRVYCISVSGHCLVEILTLKLD